MRSDESFAYAGIRHLTDTFIPNNKREENSEPSYQTSWKTSPSFIVTILTIFRDSTY